MSGSGAPAAVLLMLAILLAGWPSGWHTRRSALGRGPAPGAADVTAGADDGLTGWAPSGRRWLGRRRAARSSPSSSEVVTAVGALISGLASGSAPLEATLRLARTGTPWLGSAVDRCAATRGLVRQVPWSAESLAGAVTAADVWRAAGRDLAEHGAGAAQGSTLALRVAAVLDLAQQHGAPVDRGLRAALGATTAELAAKRARAQAVSGARATAILLITLPVLGPIVVVGLGLDPITVYLRDPVGRWAVLAGLAFTALGWAWFGVLIRRAGRPLRAETGAGATLRSLSSETEARATRRPLPADTRARRTGPATSDAGAL